MWHFYVMTRDKMWQNENIKLVFTTYDKIYISSEK
jgi:hypothetical protein